MKNTFAFLAGGTVALVGVLVGLTAKSTSAAAENVAKSAAK